MRWSDLPHAPAPGAALCALDDVPDGGAKLVTLEGFRALLTRSGADVSAFANRCAHFGVPLAERQDQLIFVPHVSVTCNVHYARYRWRDGSCERGDCDGEGLLRIPVVVDAGVVRVA